ncbi:PLP-dependent aminotransferase family protein [Aquihabitans sp. McL0605]|uniref:aminotransferase-like domain-containing protein n=1 Tax=Aquihabitans sp. McL0605 TaxID=3415671 RepID=UPI003CEF4158
MVKSLAVQRAGSSAIRDLLEITEQPHIISLAGGLPHAGAFPIAAIARAAAAALADDPLGALQYGPTEGHRPLRRWVADRYDLGPDGEEQVIITNGSQQALDLLTRALVDPGGQLALADPAYVGALQTFRAAGVDLLAIPADRDGLRVDVLAERLAEGARPAVVYVVANFDNPSGATLSPQRRIDLAALADRYGFWIIDDDPYGELRWEGTAPAALRDLTDRAITLGSTSKVLSPGLRVGWAVAPVEVRRAMTILKQSADLHTSSLNQLIVHRVLREPGFLPDHLAALRTTYGDQARHLATALEDRLGDELSFEAPGGGMFLWAQLTDPTADTAALLPVALDHGVAFVPGAAFGVDDPHRRWMRLSYATAGPTDLDQAVDRLVGVIRPG